MPASYTPCHRRPVTGRGGQAPRDRQMLTIIRIVTAAAILTGVNHPAPALAAHIVPIDRVQDAAEGTSTSAATCPVRAWPYIG